VTLITKPPRRRARRFDPALLASPSGRRLPSQITTAARCAFPPHTTAQEKVFALRAFAALPPPRHCLSMKSRPMPPPQTNYLFASFGPAAAPRLRTLLAPFLLAVCRRFRCQLT